MHDGFNGEDLLQERPTTRVKDATREIQSSK
jgi:hypothetical protein